MQYIVRMGRTDGSATKTLFFRRRNPSIVVANAMAFTLWLSHVFKRSDCKDFVRHEQGDFWMEWKAESEEFQEGDEYACA